MNFWRQIDDTPPKLVLPIRLKATKLPSIEQDLELTGSTMQLPPKRSSMLSISRTLSHSPPEVRMTTRMNERVKLVSKSNSNQQQQQQQQLQEASLPTMKKEEKENTLKDKNHESRVTPPENRSELDALNQQLHHYMEKEKKWKLKERELAEKIAHLEESVQSKEIETTQIREQFTSQRETFNQELATLEAEQKSKRRSDETVIQQLKEEIVRLKKQIDELQRTNETNQLKMTNDFEEKLAERKSYYENELKIRDEKIAKFKKNFESNLNDNSWERQQQIEELSRELAKAHEEIAILRTRLQRVSKQGGDLIGKEDSQSKSVIRKLDQNWPTVEEQAKQLLQIRGGRGDPNPKKPK